MGQFPKHSAEKLPLSDFVGLQTLLGLIWEWIHTVRWPSAGREPTNRRDWVVM